MQSGTADRAIRRSVIHVVELSLIHLLQQKKQQFFLSAAGLRCCHYLKRNLSKIHKLAYSNQLNEFFKNNFNLN